MTAKEYLSQARYLDMRIQSKLEQLESLNELATKCTSVITGMPTKPKRPCSHPSCPRITDGRFCEEHQRQENKRYEKYDRNPAMRRRYGRTWKRIRDRHIAAHPLCEMCKKQGRITPAEEAHHIKPLSQGGRSISMRFSKRKEQAILCSFAVPLGTRLWTVSLTGRSWKPHGDTLSGLAALKNLQNGGCFNEN